MVGQLQDLAPLEVLRIARHPVAVVWIVLRLIQRSVSLRAAYIHVALLWHILSATHLLRPLFFEFLICQQLTESVHCCFRIGSTVCQSEVPKRETQHLGDLGSAGAKRTCLGREDKFTKLARF